MSQQEQFNEQMDVLNEASGIFGTDAIMEPILKERMKQINTNIQQMKLPRWEFVRSVNERDVCQNKYVDEKCVISTFIFNYENALFKIVAGNWITVIYYMDESEI